MATPPTSGPYYIGHNRFLYQYVADRDKCVKKMKVPKWVDDGSAVASHGERVVIVGGWHGDVGRKRVLLLDMTGRGTVRRLPALPEPLCYTGVILSGNDVYVIGGHNNNIGHLSTVYHLSIGNVAWQTKKSMPLAVHSSLVVRHQQCIYVLGGHSAANGRQDSALRYKIQDDTWKRCLLTAHFMSFNNNVAGVVVHENKIKVFTVNECVTYDASVDGWFVWTYYSQNNKAIGEKVNAFVSGGQIRGTVWGGDYENHNMMSYDEQNGKWIIQKRCFTSGWRTKLFC